MKKHLRQRKTSIRAQLIKYIWICIVPFVLLIGVTMVSFYRYYQQYDQLVSNITSANEYNITFKEDMDEMMYRIIIGSANWSNPEEKLEGDDPKEMIAEAKEHFTRLREQTQGTRVRADLDALIKLLGILDNRVDDILQNVAEGGHYDENMEMLDMNIRTLTDLIQNDIHVYINDEVGNMELVRQSVAENLRLSMKILLAMLLILLGFIYMISKNIAGRVTRPVTELCEMTEKFAGGDFSVSCHAQDNLEMEQLTESFNSMVGEIAHLVEDIHTEQKNARDAELRLLQEQINPHFLYNTLDTIIWLTEAGDFAQAVQMIQHLSRFFRTTLSKGRDMVTVREEQEHIESYLNIQRFRYQDILDYRIDFAPEIAEYQIQKLTLQPIVENALYHGIKNKRGKGLITVSGRQEGDVLVFTVEDNGIGMTEAELCHLRELISGKQEPESQNGFGMSNVQKRIQMQYGVAYGITAASIYGEGTVIEVRISAMSPKAETEK